jgi:hypothetical protein
MLLHYVYQQVHQLRFFIQQYISKLITNTLLLKLFIAKSITDTSYLSK